VNLLWTPHNLASVGTLRAQIPTESASAGLCGAAATSAKMRSGARCCCEELRCEDQVLDGPASGEKGSKGRNALLSGFLPILARAVWSRVPRQRPSRVTRGGGAERCRLRIEFR